MRRSPVELKGTAEVCEARLTEGKRPRLELRSRRGL